MLTIAVTLKYKLLCDPTQSDILKILKNIINIELLLRDKSMGNKLKQSSLFQKTALSQIGTISICPNC